MHTVFLVAYVSVSHQKVWPTVKEIYHSLIKVGVCVTLFRLCVIAYWITHQPASAWGGKVQHTHTHTTQALPNK